MARYDWSLIKDWRDVTADEVVSIIGCSKAAAYQKIREHAPYFTSVNSHHGLDLGDLTRPTRVIAEETGASYNAIYYWRRMRGVTDWADKKVRGRDAVLSEPKAYVPKKVEVVIEQPKPTQSKPEKAKAFTMSVSQLSDLASALKQKAEEARSEENRAAPPTPPKPVVHVVPEPDRTPSVQVKPQQRHYELSEQNRKQLVRVAAYIRKDPGTLMNEIISRYLRDPVIQACIDD